MSDTLNDATTSDFDNSAQWTTEDFQRALRTISELRRELQEARAALSGRTISCSQCNESAKQIDAMREATKEAYEALTVAVQHITVMHRQDYDDYDDCVAALAKLTPFLKL